jgi:hypothetical protein
VLDLSVAQRTVHEPKRDICRRPLRRDLRMRTGK